jgi:hypothetical protein
LRGADPGAGMLHRYRAHDKSNAREFCSV